MNEPGTFGKATFFRLIFSMKTVYFDTTTYNRIVDDPTQRLQKFLHHKCAQKEIKLVASVLNLEEILNFQKNPEKRNRMLDLILAYAFPKILDDHTTIIKKDFESALRSQCESENIFSNLNWPLLISQAKNDVALSEQELQEVIEKSKIRKRDFRDQSREHVKELRPLWNEHRGIISYEDFFQESMSRGSIFEGLCSRYYGEETGKFLYKHLPLKNMHRMRRLLKYCIGLIYDELASPQPVTPSWGNAYDMLHSLYLGSCNVFVTDDEGFFRITSRFNESNFAVMSVKDFFSN